MRRVAVVIATAVAVAAVVVATAGVNAAEPAAFSGAAQATVQAGRLQPPPRTFSLAATGDVLTESAVNVAAANGAGPGVRFDYTPVLGTIAPVVRAADLAICHMEIPIGRPGERPGVYGRSAFGGNLLLAPYEVAGGLRDAGFDRCSTASNHSNDLGPGGIATTLAAFEEAGLGHTGTARSPAESQPQLFSVNGIRVAHLSYTNFSNSNLPAESWRVHYTKNPGVVVDDVAGARAAGAEVVIVSIHVSQEMLPGPTPDDRAFVTAITRDADIDLVIQHGPHVIQPLEQVNGTWVFWSLGNLVSGMGWAQSGRYADQRTLDGLLASVRFTETTSGQFTVEAWPVLLCNERVGRTVHPVTQSLADPAISAGLRDQLQQCLERSLPVVTDLR